MTLKIEHNGRDLTFHEHDESWSCHAMNMRAKSLKALKAKLDKFDGQARRVNVPVMIVGTHGDKARRAEIVMIAKPKDWEIDYEAKTSGFEPRPKRPSVWVSSVQGNETKREKVLLDRCLPVSAEVTEALEAAQAKFAEATRIRSEGAAIIAGLARLSIEDLTARSVIEDDDES